MQYKEKNKRILIITSEGFPNGNAIANRIITIAKSLLNYGYYPKVLITRNTELKAKPINSTYGNIEGIDYKYAYKINTRGHKVIHSIFLKIIFFLNTITYLYSERRDTKLIIVYTTSFFNELVLIYLSRILKIEIWKDESEIPEIYFWKKGIYTKIKKYFYLRHIYDKYTGLMLITNNLVDYFKHKLINSKVKLIHVPLMVDFDRFKSFTDKSDVNEKIICYIGSINKKKDGVDQLIFAFREVSIKHPNIKLYLVGEYVVEFENDFDLKSILQLNNTEFTDKIILTGKVSSVEVIQYLNIADILVLPRPKSKQAEYGFPTKLGEYLASKKPVICTIFGEVENYLTNNLDCLLIPSNDINALVKALIRLLEDETFAVEIGMQGYKSAEANFNKSNIVPLINEIIIC